MRMILVSLVAMTAMGALAGCAPSQFDTDKVTNLAQGGGLTVQVQLPKRYFRTGEQVDVAVVATNTTAKPIEICSPTGAPVLVRITRHTLLYPEQVHVYPTSATANILSWTLPAGKSRQFALRVPVEPDWPVEEILFLSAELNGYAQLAPGLAIMVKQPQKEQ